MPTVSAKINPKEYDAITHYANACGETAIQKKAKERQKEKTKSQNTSSSEGKNQQDSEQKS